jgi:hypothetical protein
MLDPRGEFDTLEDWPQTLDWRAGPNPQSFGWHAGAVRPLDGVRARAVLLHLSERLPAQPRVHRDDGDEQDILLRLGVDPSKGHGMVKCPAHEDRNASLSWRWDGSKALLHCFRGCSFSEIVGAI